jgi:Matrixin
MSRRLALAALSVLSVAGLAAAPANAADRTASAIGVANVNGKDVQVEVVVEVPRGQSAREATDEALAGQGARPKPPKPPKQPPGGGGGAAPQPGGPTFTGLVWDVLPVAQYYNGTGAAVSAQSDLTATQSAWSSVQGSRFRMSFGGTTTRCPSIVRECPGPQMLDGFNDVGWASLGAGVLGVTWSTTGGQDEADMALNNGVPWNAGCANVPGSFSAQTVLLHENGHVAGLGHAASTASVMYPSYLTADCTLGTPDHDAIRRLYPG